MVQSVQSFRRLPLLAVALAGILGLSACEVNRATGQRAAGGAAIGAGVGAVSGLLGGGSVVGNTVTGAAAGAAGGVIYDQIQKR